VREFVRELARQRISVQLRDLPRWSARKLPLSLRDPWFETLRKPVDATAVLHFCMPHQVQPYPDRWNINFTMFEAVPAPPVWVARNLHHDLVVVPTVSSRRAWVEGGMPEERIRLCPLGTDAQRFNGAAEPLPLRLPGSEPVGGYRVRFLNVSEINPRKNIAGLLRTWMKATNADDDAILILKLGYGDEGQLRAFRAEVDGLRLESGKTLAEAAPVHFLYDLYSDSEMPRLYCTATHYCSMSFGEGWDQPAMEAAACGLRLIVPNHSAYSSYLDSSVASLIPSREVPARWTGDPAMEALFEHARWWEPDEEHAAACIRSAIDGRDAGKPTAQSRIQQSFTWEKAARRLTSILAELDPPRRRFWPFSFSRTTPARMD
jgi:glycosyltransferase involved in cell wall biosynthesis